MSKSSKDLGNNRFRESFGRYFEEFEVGHIYDCLLYTSDAADE